MPRERMEELMKAYPGIGVETDRGQRYFYEAFGNDFEDAVKRVNETFSDHRFGKYKVFIAHSVEVERLKSYLNEEVVIYKTYEGDVAAVLENEAIRVFQDVDTAISKLHRAGFVSIASK